MCAPPSSSARKEASRPLRRSGFPTPGIVAHRLGGRWAPNRGGRHRVRIEPRYPRTLVRPPSRRTRCAAGRGNHCHGPGGGPGGGESAAAAAVAARDGRGAGIRRRAACGCEPVSSPRRHPGRTPKEVSDMRPRTVARPAAAGALSFAFTCAGAQTALAQTETTQPTTNPPRSGAGAAHRRRPAPAQRALRQPHRGQRPARARRAGVTVSLQVKRGTAGSRSTGRAPMLAGRYRLRERLRRTGSTRVRIRVAGGPGVAPASARSAG